MYTLSISFILVFLLHFPLKASTVNGKNMPLWSSATIEKELAEREIRFQEVLNKKLSEVILYISKNDLKSASAILTLIKAKTVGENDYVNYLDAYIDSRLQRTDSAIRSLKKISIKDNDLLVKKCFLWLKILWDEKRWQDVRGTLDVCQSTLAQNSKDELFYTKNLLNLYTTQLNTENIVPSPFFYFFAPDFLKIEQWISLLIKTNNEQLALPHLRRIPDESLNKGSVRLLTAMALWNAKDFDYSQTLMEQVVDKDDWNYKRLITAVALSKNNLQIAWDTNRELLIQRPDLMSNQSLQMALAWKMNLVELLKIKDLKNKQLVHYDPEIVPLIAGMLFIKGQNQQSVELLQQSQPTLNSTDEHQIAYWGVRQWISLRNNNLGNFMSDAIQSCEKQVSFGCWMILSGQEKISLDKSDLFPYDSVGDYFRENL